MRWSNPLRYVCNCTECRSQWPPGLRHKLSSPAQTLGSWVRIPLEAWMYVCVYSVCVVLCVGSGLSTGWSPIQGVLPTVNRITKLKSDQGPKKSCRAIDSSIEYEAECLWSRGIPKIGVFWDTTPCSLLENYHRFSETCFLYLHDRRIRGALRKGGKCISASSFHVWLTFLTWRRNRYFRSKHW
jgi:hypothetical protein